MKIKLLFVFFIISILGYIFTSCKESIPPKSEAYLKGEAIAKRVCSSCHIYTPPDLLDQISWPNVLSVMNAEMKKMDIEPSYDDWIATQRFYLTQAPRTFQSTTIQKPITQELFKEKEIRNDSVYHGLSTLLYINEDGAIDIGQSNGIIHNYQSDTLASAFVMNNIPISMSSDYILGMGSLGPSDDVNGELIYHKDDTIESIADWLSRPIHFQNVDLNNDGQEEFIISSFGSPTNAGMTGALVLVSKEDDVYKKVVLDSTPGATMTKTYDINEDGHLDIIALFSQGNESIKIYYNQGDLSFKASPIIIFPPVYGTNSFDIADINGDGHIDLLVTAGDNDDYSQVFKPYHGIRIFINDGENTFEETYFYPINGASKVVIADFNKDGDLDFVVLAMYPDLFSRPWETLIYFENNGRMDFTVKYFEEQPGDNWVLMDVGDVDSDGDLDIVCAANQSIHGLLPPALQKTWKEDNIGLKIWENKLIK